jgi:hypothetical protein
MEEKNMNYTELIINGESYKLKLTTKASVALERTLGYNPITLLMDIDKGRMPKLNDVLIILHGMLQTYHHGINMDKVFDLFDDYVAQGGSMIDLITLFVKVFEVSGYLGGNTASGEVEKN